MRERKVLLIDVVAEIQPQFQSARMKNLLRNVLSTASAHILCAVALFKATHLCLIYFLCWFVLLAPLTTTNQSFSFMAMTWKVSSFNVNSKRTPEGWRGRGKDGGISTL